MIEEESSRVYTAFLETNEEEAVLIESRQQNICILIINIKRVPKIVCDFQQRIYVPNPRFVHGLYRRFPPLIHSR